MNSLPKISIITVVFNGVQFIESTIRSVIGQNYPNFEYLIIDGKSTDGTVDLIKKYEDNIGFWVSEPDQGIYDAMNKGLKKATGDFVLFMNAGDAFYEKNTLSKIPFEQHPNADIFYGETVIIDENTGEELGLRRKKLPIDLDWKHYKKGMVACHQSSLVRKNIAGEYNTEYKLSADIDWVIRALKKSRETVFTQTIVARFLNGGVSRKQQKNSLKERFNIMRKYFGLPQTIISHIGFFIESLAIKAGLKPLFRKNTFVT
ncbi:glycosyltransferase family 2 protein [Maribellus mangrovi]|uniref:glycosyltransferase family 2 protein n=1 Tax=Maribellus mangrovi TaxID=3133146 RepID=UPI0030EDCCD4